MIDRAVVAHRLQRLFTEWPTEQALQFEGRWWMWGDVAHVYAKLSVHAPLVSAEAAAGRSADLAVEAPVAIVMRQRPALVAAELAVLAAGRAAVLVSPLQPDRELAAEIERLAPAIVLAHVDDWPRIGVVDGLSLEIDDDFELAVRGDRAVRGATLTVDAGTCVTVLTSGTTGPAKRLPVTWETFARLGGVGGVGGAGAVGAVGAVGVAAGDEHWRDAGRTPRSGRGAIILTLPLMTLGGLLSMARLVFGGRPMSMMERFDVHTWAAFVKEHRPQVIGAPPPAVKMILDEGITADHFEGVSAFTTASAPVDPAVAAEFERRYGIPVLQGYGATEFLSSVTGWTATLYREWSSTKLGSVGRALAGVKLRVVDEETGGDVAPGAVGLLEVDPPQRAGHLPDGWLRTSDRARIDADDFVWILGRADDVIIRGGFKVDLGVIEAALREHAAVGDAFVVDLPDERVGQVPGALVVPADRWSPPTPSELEAWLRDRVPAYAVPAVIRLVDRLPETPTFKRHRAEARRLLS